MHPTRYLPITLLFLATSATFADDAPTFDVRFGVLGSASPGAPLTVTAETNEIPLKHCKAGARFGYAVTHKEGRRFSTHAVFYPPTPLTRIEEGMWGTAKAAPTEGVTSNPSSYTGHGVEEYCFTDGDPAGEWKVDIFVNAVKFSTLSFNAIK